MRWAVESSKKKLEGSAQKRISWWAQELASAHSGDLSGARRPQPSNETRDRPDFVPDTALRRPPQEPPRDDGAKCSLERRRAQRSSPNCANIFAVSAGRPLFSVTIAELRHKLKQKSQGPRPFVVASACAARAGLQGPASSSPAKRQRAFLLRFLLPPV